ncbi:hypothetical protein EGI26_09485 [Lacihabitans sp. CCS-44]|uniref:hypothetical protein n=1 Tax=Lacihabitans sp. CCS-44 TaxID=2487331 RepID=UPI0020CC29AB|nr:hypothetical protein [Lacihabitans sp. CCS-44]MCP9754884.1 hypothetical protein [Lacihabitans sp. CCS-44]MCP9754886.1 hypothetical protein [Lacihabitans sp. CCS-44]MCP9754887.1 hypothetical protein [Lacihabitans sp. CCS-44]MCP9754888.1 hypothetical protein [Lacihabitans sp. CCS-44]MCP9754936.1 hypothetical protein [Lacihabitans sp. CCS-44]
MNQDLIRLLLPEGLFEYFEVVKVEKVENSYNIHITELNLIPKEFDGQKGSIQKVGGNEKSYLFWDQNDIY